MLIKRLTLVVLCSAGLAVAASAQRGGGGPHGSAGGRAGPAIGGASAGGAPRSGLSSSLRFSASRPLMTGSRPINTAPAFRANYPGIQGRRNGAGPNGFNGYRRPYHGDHRGRSYPSGPWAGWSGATFIGYPGGLGFDNGDGAYSDNSAYVGNDQAPYGDGDQGSYTQAPDPNQPMPYLQSPQYVAAPPEPPQPSAVPAPEPQPEDAVTLVFKDGRPTEQIHNYMLTRTTLYVRDQHRREIALADLDLAATKQVNKAEGVDFQFLPEASH